MSKSLSRDTRWEGFVNNSYEYFESIANDIKFLDGVPEDVVLRFKLVKDLIKQSYFVYDFFDAAYERALLTLELAIQRRYEEIEDDEWNSDFEQLIKWGAENKMFEDEEEVIHAHREFRNRIAHPEQYSLLGFTGVQRVFRTVEIINGLYHDREKRIKRKKETEEINKGLHSFLENGGTILINSNKYLIFRGSVLLIDNFHSEKTYYFIFWKIFDPKMKNDTLTTPDPFIIRAYDFMKVQGSYYISSTIDPSVTIAKITKDENRKKFEKFLTEYRDIPVARMCITTDNERFRELFRKKVFGQLISS